MKSILNKFGIYLLNFIAAIWIGILTEFAAILLFKLIVPTPSFLQTCLVNGIAQASGMLFGLYRSSKKVGYRSKESSLSATLPAVAMVFALQAVLAYLMNFMIYIAGPITHFAQAIQAGNQEIYWQDWSEAPIGLYYSLLIAFDLLCLIAILLGEKSGNRKHQTDYAETAKQSVAVETTSVPVYGRPAPVPFGAETTVPDTVQVEASSSNTPKRSALEILAEEKDAAKLSATTPANTQVKVQAPTPTPKPTPLPPERISPKASARPQIPLANADLRRKVWWRTVPSITVGILSAIAYVILLGHSLWVNHDTPAKISGAIFLYTLLCLAPIAAFKSWERITDRSFEGQVAEMEFQHRTKQGLDRRVHHYTIAHLVVREDSGRQIKFDYMVKGAVPFGPGSRIRHYAATDFMYLLDEDKPIVCVNCGNHYSRTPEIHSDEDLFFNTAGYDLNGTTDPLAHIPDRCGFCKMSIIKESTKRFDPLK